MKPFITALALLALTGAAQAQQQPDDPQLAIYQQLLSEANARLVASAAQQQATVQSLNAAQTRVKQLEDKYEPERADAPKEK